MFTLSLPCSPSHPADKHTVSTAYSPDFLWLQLKERSCWQVNKAAAAQVAAAKQASAEAKVRVAADAERRVDETRAELARVKEQLAAVLDYKQRKEVLEEEVAKLNAEMLQLRSDTAEQVLSQLSSHYTASNTHPAYL